MDKINVEKVVPAVDASISEVVSFIEQEMKKNSVPMKVSMQVSVATEELLVNIVKYAYPNGNGFATISLEMDSNSLCITFKDSGIEFNPLLKADPDITLSAEERKIGGLGIFMVKKTMDDVKYQYKDKMNILSIYKKW